MRITHPQNDITRIPTKTMTPCVSITLSVLIFFSSYAHPRVAAKISLTRSTPSVVGDACIRKKPSKLKIWGKRIAVFVAFIAVVCWSSPRSSTSESSQQKLSLPNIALEPPSTARAQHQGGVSNPQDAKTRCNRPQAQVRVGSDQVRVGSDQDSIRADQLPRRHKRRELSSPPLDTHGAPLGPQQRGREEYKQEEQQQSTYFIA